LFERFSPISIFLSLVSSRAFRDAPPSRFILLLALPQIYARVFHLWKSVSLDNAWVKDSRPFIYFHSRDFARLVIRPTRVFLRGHPKLCLRGFLKMLVLALPKIYTSAFHL